MNERQPEGVVTETGETLVCGEVATHSNKYNTNALVFLCHTTRIFYLKLIMVALCVTENVNDH